MPNIWGGDQMDPDYAPWAWIGDEFVGRTGKTVTHQDVEYRIGKNATGKIVCKRVESGGKEKSVPLDEIPQEVLDSIEKKSFKESKKEVETLAREIQPDMDEGDILKSEHWEE